MERREKRTKGRATIITTITKRWCDLPEDILRFIMSKLNLVDRSRLRSVCKKWQIPIFELSPMDKYPWSVNYSFAKYKGEAMISTCFLFDPHYKKNYCSRYKIELKHAEKIVEGIYCASKYSWLLVSNKHRETTSFMFYNPFIKEAIPAPDLDFCFDVATFSLSPTSPDCYIFASHYVNGAWLGISVYHSGDNEWSTQIFKERLNKKILDVVYLDGVFYCICDCGWLGAFTVVDQRWSLVKNSIPVGMIETKYKVHLLANDGHLLLAIMDHQVCKNVIKFDWSKMTWETANAMGNQTLFLGPTSFSTSTVEKTGNLPYDCNYHDYYTKLTFSDIEKDGNPQCWEIYGVKPSSPQPSSRRRLIWIEPPHI